VPPVFFDQTGLIFSGDSHVRRSILIPVVQLNGKV
jgi:hypothetical protein